MPNMAPRFETFIDKAGKWRWHARAENGRIVADSGEGYENYEGCLNGIQVMKGLANADVISLEPTMKMPTQAEVMARNEAAFINVSAIITNLKKGSQMQVGPRTFRALTEHTEQRENAFNGFIEIEGRRAIWAEDGEEYL